MSKDSFDESSEYSYQSIPEETVKSFKIDIFYIICFIIGLFLIYYFYSGNIFITIIELVLNFSFPYIYIVLKIFLSKKIIVEKLKQHENNIIN